MLSIFHLLCFYFFYRYSISGLTSLRANYKTDSETVPNHVLKIDVMFVSDRNWEHHVKESRSSDFTFDYFCSIHLE
jgi:hypothetical protein